MTVSMLLSSQKAVFEDKLSHNAVPSSQKAVFEDGKAFTTGLSSGRWLFEDKRSHNTVPSSQKAVFEDGKAFTTGLSSGKCLFEDKRLKSHFVRGKAVIPDEIHLQKKHSSSYVTEEEGNMYRKYYS